MEVEVAYAEAERAIVRRYRLASGAKVAEALALAAVDPGFFGVDLARARVGIFGRTVTRDTQLADQDRVEIYRPLAEDPKLARRRRARGR